MRTMPGVGHNDLVALAGTMFAEQISAWASELIPGFSEG